MDHIGSIWEKLKKNIMGMGLRKALITYIMIGSMAAATCSFATIIFCESWKNIIKVVHGDVGNSIIFYNIIQCKVVENGVSKSVENQILILSIIEIVLCCSFVIGAIVLVSYFYYKGKLQEPLRILQEEMSYISRDDLSFECSYESADEMGDICAGFNSMRKQLVENKQNIWELMESQRELNAAFAHDIRTPLTVMKGYTQMIQNFYPSGQITQAQLLETLELISGQVERMENFSNTMKEIHTFEELEPNRREIMLSELFETILQIANGVETEQIKIIVQREEHEKDLKMFCDERMIIEVFENLLSNALRFAKQKIVVRICIEDCKMSLFVKDDGNGFDQEVLEKAVRPYFTTDKEHFGIGLSICKMLCKKQGGSLEIMNSIEKGGIICATFFVA